MRMPGRLSPEARREVDSIRANQRTLGGNIEKREKKAKQPRKAVDHIPGSKFRDGHEALREGSSGRFAKEITPKHKRPERIPWEKKL
jgi:hypothetical protein